MQSLIKQEVRSAMEKNETNLKALIETIEHLDRNIDYESTIQKLEVGWRGGGGEATFYYCIMSNFFCLTYIRNIWDFKIPSLCL